MDEVNYRLSKFFQLLGNGVRLDMAEQLLEDTFYVKELAEKLGRSEKTMSRHFRVFRDQDMVSSESRNKTRVYELKQPELVREALALRKYFERETE